MKRRRCPVELDGGWRDIVTGVANLMPILDGVEGESFTTEEYIHLYTTMYDMLTQKSPMNQSQQFYDRYKASLDEYLKSTVLPSLKDKHGEFLLRELVQRWTNHKLMVRWLSRFFHYLVHYYVSQKSLRPLTQPGWSCFHDLVFVELKNAVTTIVVGMVDDEREGQLIDRFLLKNVLDIYVEIGFGDLGVYEVDFEQAFLKGTIEYYSKKARTWILEDSCPEYMLKVEECLQQEKQRLTHYLHCSTEPKLMEDARSELITRHKDEILSKENSGCRMLLRDEKTDDLSRMFRLFSRMENGLLLVLKIFKEHVNEEAMSLLEQAIYTARSKKNEKDVTSSLEQELNEVFEGLSNKDVAGCTCAELLAEFCDKVITKGGSEKLSDESIEETLEKVMDTLTYIRDKDLFLESHRKKLRRRLLVGKSVNNEHERSIISKLKRYGRQFASKLEDMINDFEDSERHKFTGYKLLGGMVPRTVDSPLTDIQSLESYLITARVTSVDSGTGLASNKIVEQFNVAWDNGRTKARYTPVGYSIFGGLISHVTNAHEVNKSWNGRISTKMFLVWQGQIHIDPRVIPMYLGSSDYCTSDFHAVGNILLNESALITSQGTIYPIHLRNLCVHLSKATRKFAHKMFRTYVRCNPTFWSQSQCSVVYWHLRRYDLSMDSSDRKNFKKIIEKNQKPKREWYTDIKYHQLFRRTFEEAKRRGASYGPGAYELYRFLRDWHTHGIEHLPKSLKSQYNFNVMEFVVVVLFEEILGDTLYHLLTNGINIDEWLSGLNPALPNFLAGAVEGGVKFKGG